MLKGQLISKAIYGLLTSPKKRMNEFDLFAFLLFTTNKSNSSVCFLGESTARQSAFLFYLTFICFYAQTKVSNIIIKVLYIASNVTTYMNVVPFLSVNFEMSFWHPQISPPKPTKVL
jgi:hypothetical protein